MIKKNNENIHHKFRSLPLSILATAMSLSLQTQAIAAEQQKKQAEGLEVIVVTSQKRVEDAQDIPLSINVVSGIQMQEDNIEKIEDLQYSVPNLQMTETGIGTQIYIRGIGSGNNQGFEQSVGQYIDGIYYGRQQLIRAPFLDLERIEVLRGPQSILFGKNSIAGALNMVTAVPDDITEAAFGLHYQPDFGLLETTGMISGALSDEFFARLAVRKYSEDGFVENSFKNNDEPEKDDLAIRATFRWQPSDDIDLILKLEQDDFDTVGRQIEVIRDDAALEGAPIPGANFSQIMTALGHPNALTETEFNFERQANGKDFSHNQLKNITLTGNFNFGDYTLTSITGNVSYEFNEGCDCDFIAAPVFDATQDEQYDQFSQELRIVSPLNDSFNWLGGVFYQTSELEFSDTIYVPQDSVLGLLSGGALAPLTGDGATRNYGTDSDLWAVFFQGRYHLSEKLSATFGARYTKEEKTAYRKIDITDSTHQQITEDPMAPILFTAVFGIDNEQFTGHNLTGSRDESSFTPSVNLQYRQNDDVMYYFAATTGFKSGGFDARSNNINSWEFENEEATSYELGIKSRLFDNTLEANLTLYHTDYDDLQVSQFDGLLGFTVGNAKKTQVQGVELDGRWFISPELEMHYALAYLDHEFKDFSNGNCYNRQTPDGDIGPNGNQLCDYTGKSGQYTPKFTSNISLDYNTEISFAGFDNFTTTFSAYHSSEQDVDANLNPLYRVNSYTKFNMRIALESEFWSLAVIGKNLTDEKVLTYVGNVPLSGSTFGTNTFYGFVDRPRTVGIQLDYRY